MPEKKQGEEVMNLDPGLDRNLERLDEDLQIMEKHAAELAEAEESIQESMKKRDREYKDEKFHSIPRARKHVR